MNRVLLFKEDRVDNKSFCLRDPYRNEHLRNHLKVQKGDKLKVSLLNEGLALATISHIDKENIELCLCSEIKTPLPSNSPPEIHLYIAASRPPTMKKIIEHGTTQGVHSFHFFRGKLSEKSYLKSKVFEDKKMLELASRGVSQSGSLWKLPTFHKSNSLEEALKGIESPSFFLDQKGKFSLKAINFSLPKNLPKKMNFFIGPERGWTPQEEDFLRQQKLSSIRLSKHILRVENATLALLSQLELLLLEEEYSQG